MNLPFQNRELGMQIFSDHILFLPVLSPAEASGPGNGQIATDICPFSTHFSTCGENCGQHWYYSPGISSGIEW